MARVLKSEFLTPVGPLCTQKSLKMFEYIRDTWVH